MYTSSVPFDRILVPTDFSSCADRALAYAETFVGCFDAELHVLHAANQFSAGVFADAEADDLASSRSKEIEQADIKETIQERVQALFASADRAAEAHVSVQSGLDVADVITSYAENKDIDLVVIGTHGRRGLRRFMLGSIADTVLRRAPCPVVSVRSAEEEGPALQKTLDHILAPIDFSDDSKKALRLAKKIAVASGAHLSLLFVAERRVVPIFSDTGLPGVGVVDMGPEAVENAEAALRELDDRQKISGVESSYHVLEGQADEHIARFADRRGMDLIVMANRGLGAVDRTLLGSTTERVTRRSFCPVLTFSPSVADDQEETPSQNG